MQARKIRLLRKKYRITLAELAAVCSFSEQRISEIELGVTPLSPATTAKIQSGFEKLMEQHQEMLLHLNQDYTKHRETLFEPVEEIGYEL